jgi:hypothetical protein
MAKYSKAAGKSVKKAMHKKKRGELKSGSGRTVRSRKQAIAIGLSEARKKGAKVPKKGASKSAKKGAKKGRKGAKKTAKKTARKRS